MAEPVKICIVMDGGLVQAVFSAGVPVEYVKVDYDTEGADPDDLADVPQDGGGTCPAFVSSGDAETDESARAFTLRAFDLVGEG